jgi:multidrug efflux pump subunit AcrB
MPSPIIYARATFVVGLLPIALGINAVARPASALALLQFPAPTDPAARKVTESVLQMYGARNITLGLSTLAVWYAGSHRTLGLVMLAGIPLALIDGFVSLNQIGSGQWGHWSACIVGGVLGLGLLGYL